MSTKATPSAEAPSSAAGVQIHAGPVDPSRPLATFTAGDPPEIALHPMSEVKMVVMCLCTFGVYAIYWFYRNWRLRKLHRGRDVVPVLRSVFAVLFAFSLFEEVRDESRRRGVEPGWSPGWLALAYFVWTLSARLPDPAWLVSLFSFVPLVFVQDAINRANALSEHSAPVDDHFSVWNWLGIVFGSLFLVLVVVGSFLPAEV